MPRPFENAFRTRFEAAFFAALPDAPGVYFMRADNNQILYIGKAKSLKARLLSYRGAKPGQVADNVLELARRVRKIDWELHPSETAAALRERELIRALVPPLNIADAWAEDYLFIGLQGPVDGYLRFRLTSRESDGDEFTLHGCYSHRRLTKNAYSALLRVLYACTPKATAAGRDRFRIPAALARSSPLYNYRLQLDEAARWKRLLSSYLHGRKSRLVRTLLESLLENDQLPAYVRPALERDLKLLRLFERLAQRGRLEAGSSEKLITQRRLRDRIRQSIHPEAPVTLVLSEASDSEVAVRSEEKSA